MRGFLLPRCLPYCTTSDTQHICPAVQDARLPSILFEANESDQKPQDAIPCWCDSMVRVIVDQSIKGVIDHTGEVFTKKGPPNWKTGANNSDMHLYHPKS
jgi:hypothetical protein